jgi:hypothetical protein
MPTSPPKSPKSRRPRWGWSGVSILPSGDQAFDEVLRRLPSLLVGENTASVTYDMPVLAEV